MCTRFFTCLTGALLVSITSAQAQHFEDSYGDGAGFGPWGVPVTTYHKLMSSPNATSSYPVPGSVSGWSFAVSVIADIPMSESNSSTAQAHPNKAFTGTRVVLQAPANPIHESSSVCVLQWDITPFSYPPKLRADDGSCSSFLSEQCIRDVEARSAEHSKTTSSRCTCPKLSEISSCGGDQAKTLMAAGTCQARRKHPLPTSLCSLLVFPTH